MQNQTLYPAFIIHFFQSSFGHVSCPNARYWSSLNSNSAFALSFSDFFNSVSTWFFCVSKPISTRASVVASIFLSISSLVAIFSTARSFNLTCIAVDVSLTISAISCVSASAFALAFSFSI